MRYFLSFCAILCFIVVNAQSSLQNQLESDIASYQELLDQRRADIEALETELGATRGALDERITERDRFSSELVNLRSERETLLIDIETLNASLAETESQIGGLETDVGLLREQVQKLLVSLYKQKGNRLSRALGQADSLHDLQVRNYYLSRLSRQNIQLINSLTSTADELSIVQAEQAQQLASLNQKSEALIANEISLSSKEAELKNIITELESTREGQLALQVSLLKEQQDLEDNIRSAMLNLDAEKVRLQREVDEARAKAEAAASSEERRDFIDQAEDAEARLAALGKPLPPAREGFVYPIDNPTLAGNFGEGGFTGVALRSDAAGVAVRAVQTGVVITVLNTGANDGYMVLLKHGGDINTAYVNLQATPAVEVGDTVTQGDLLGYIGGGTLTAPNILKFYVADAAGGFVNPAELLGF